MKTEIQNEIAQYLLWDPSEEGLEPHVEVNRTKINHVFKRHFSSIGYEEIFVKAAGGSETLYNVVAKMTLANLFHYMCDKVTVEQLVEKVKEGLNERGVYNFVITDVDTWINTIRDGQQEVHNAYASGAHDFDLSKCELKVPPIAERNALNSILGTVAMPPIEHIVGLAKDSFDKIKDAQDAEKAARKESEALKKDMDALQSEVANMTLRIETMGSTGEIDLEASSDGTIPEGKVVTKKASEVFGMDFKTDFDLPVFEWDGVHPDVPRTDSHYIFRHDELLRVLYAIVTNQRAYLHGHTGSGKTTLIEQACARMGWPFIRVNFDSEITRMDLIGRDTLTTDEDGNTVSLFVDGILPNAMSRPGILCADEIDFVRPDVSYVMQAALEGNGLRITEDGDRMVKPDPMFRMFATGNTVGQGDENGMYQGARPQSMALLDRFTVWVHIDYLSPEDREGLVKRHYPAMSEKDRKALCKYTTEHLEAFTSGKISQPISPRGMLAIARATVLLSDLPMALRMSVLDRASNDDRATLRGLVDRVS